MADYNDALAARTEGEIDPQFEPVIRLTEQVDTKTGEEEDDVVFKLRAKLFRFDSNSSEWKERGTGDVRLLQNTESKKIRLVMRRDKTLKVCANHSITSDMHLQPNIGSDRSWVWKVAADYSESPPTAETLAIRFANSTHAAEFKTEFENAQQINAGGASRVASQNPSANQPKAEEAMVGEPARDVNPDAEKLKEEEKRKTEEAKVGESALADKSPAEKLEEEREEREKEKEEKEREKQAAEA